MSRLQPAEENYDRPIYEDVGQASAEESKVDINDGLSD